MANLIWISTPQRPPLEAEQVLRSFGVKVSNRAIRQDGDITEAKVSVSAKQLRWAASLLVGEGFTVVEPANAPAAKPRTRWGVERRSYGPQSIVVYVMESLFGVQYHKRAPIRRRQR